jgi:sec-independent protein translocase protein TatA
MMGNSELFLLLFIVLLLFGARKLPELAKGMGTAVREFNVASDESNSYTPRSKEDEKKYAIIDAAKKLGIETEGRSIHEISEEIVKFTQKK